MEVIGYGLNIKTINIWIITMYSQTHLIPLCLLEGAQNPSPKISCGPQTREKEGFTPQSRECKSSSGKERFNKSAAPVIRMIRAHLLGGGNIRWGCKHIIALVKSQSKRVQRIQFASILVEPAIIWILERSSAWRSNASSNLESLII